MDNTCKNCKHLSVSVMKPENYCDLKKTDQHTDGCSDFESYACEPCQDKGECDGCSDCPGTVNIGPTNQIEWMKKYIAELED